MKWLLILALALLAGCSTIKNEGNGTPVSMVTKEIPRNEQIDTAVHFLFSPANAQAGNIVNLKWEIVGSGTAENTQVYFDKVSHTNDNKYSGATTGYENRRFRVPSSYEGQVVMPNQTVYLKAHAFVDGKDYWSDEIVIKSR